jgi:hypothetical protein
MGLTLEELQREAEKLARVSELGGVVSKDRHERLMRAVLHTCRELARGEQYAALAVLSDKLRVLQNLDLGIPPDQGEDDPVVVGDDDTGANDPMVIEEGPAGGTGAYMADSVYGASDAEEEDGANDPVILNVAHSGAADKEATDFIDSDEDGANDPVVVVH